MPEIRLKGGDLDGLLLHYREEGRGPATALSTVGRLCRVWRHNMPELARHGRVIAFDLPGSGRSGKPRRAYTLEFLAQALDRLLHALGVDRVHLVGHSLGGAVAARYALDHPGRVERLVLLGAAVPGFDLRPSWIYRTMSVRGVGEILSSFITRGICTAALARCFAHADPEEIRFFVEHEFAARASREGCAAYLSLLRSVKADFTEGAPAYRAALSRLGRGVLVVHGLQDRSSRSHTRAGGREPRRRSAARLDRCGHFPRSSTLRQ